jgi:hypothetical protein
VLAVLLAISASISSNNKTLSIIEHPTSTGTTPLNLFLANSCNSESSSLLIDATSS